MNNYVAYLEQFIADYKPEPEEFFLEAYTLAFDTLLRQYNSSLSVPVSLISDRRVPLPSITMLNYGIAYHPKGQYAYNQGKQELRKLLQGHYGPGLQYLARSVTSSNNQFLTEYNNLTKTNSDQNDIDNTNVQYSNNKTLNTLVDKYSQNPSRLFTIRAVNSVYTYPFMYSAKIRNAANKALTSIQTQARNLITGQQAQEFYNILNTVAKEYMTSLKTEQFVKNILSGILNFLKSIVMTVLRVIGTILRPILRVFWTVFSPLIPVFERIAAFSVTVTTPFRKAYQVLNVIPGFRYIRLGLLLTPLFASLFLGVPILSELVKVHDSLKIFFVQTGENLGQDLMNFVNSHTDSALLQTLGEYGAKAVTFTIGSFLPFMFGLGAGASIYLVLLILYLPLIHKALVLLKTFTGLKKDLENLVIQDIESEKTRVNRARTVLT